MRKTSNNEDGIGLQYCNLEIVNESQHSSLFLPPVPLRFLLVST